MLSILSGILNIVIGTSLTDISSIISQFNSLSDIPLELIQKIYIYCGCIVIALSIFVLLAGFLCFKKKGWGFVVVGAILGLFTIGPLLISTVLSLIALILIIISRDAFQKIKA